MAKKAAKKKGGQAGAGAGKASKDVTIKLRDGELPDPLDAPANKNLPAGPGDRVRWQNDSSRGRTIRFDFDWWPFEDPPTLIEVGKGKKSKWFRISASTPTSGYTYDVSPPLVPGTGPDEPSITVSG